MREDMFKVIVERPRRGGHWKGEAHRREDPEEAPARDGIRDRHRSRKLLNENLNPLQRYLCKQVGRPWDKVYAEICQRIDRRNTVQQHIHQHIGDFIAVKVVVIDGVICVANAWSGPRPLAERCWIRLYVDPVTGLVRDNRANDRYRREQREQRCRAQDANRRILGEWRQLHRLHGVWYELELAAIPPRPRDMTAIGTAAKPRDAVRNLCVWDRAMDGDRYDASLNEKLYGRAGVYARSKRQLGWRELQAHGLANADG